QEQSSKGLDMFILIYSAFLGPIVAILLVDYYVMRKQRIELKDLYEEKGPFAGYKPAAMIGLFVGAGLAFISVDLACIIGCFVGGLAYLLISKFGYKQSSFKKGTKYELK